MASSDILKAYIENANNNAILTQENLFNNPNTSPSIEPITPDPNYVNNYLSRIDTASYLAAKELGDFSGVTPETIEVMESPTGNLEAKLGKDGAAKALEIAQNGLNKYTASVASSRSASQILGDTLSATAGGLTGLIGTGATAATYGIEGAINSLTGSNDHSLTKKVTGASQAVSDFFNNDLTSNTRVIQRAREQALSDYRDTLSELQYQKDLREGSSEMSAGFAKFGRDVWNGISGVFDSGSKTLETGANVFGSLGGFSLGIKAGTKLAAKMVDSGVLPRFLSNIGTAERTVLDEALKSGLSTKDALKLVANATERESFALGLGDRLGAPMLMNAMAVGGEGIENALVQLDNVTNQELLDGSPVAKLYYDAFIQDGNSPEQAMKLMRNKIESSILKSAFSAGLIAGATSGKLFDRILRNPFTVNESQSLLGNMAREGMEESWETLPTPAINYAMQQNVNPEIGVTDNWGKEIGESFIGGVLGGAGGNAPSAAASMLSKVVSSTKKKLKKTSEEPEETSQNTTTGKERTNEERKEDLSNFDAKVESDASSISGSEATAGLNKVITTNEDSTTNYAEDLSDDDKAYLNNVVLNKDNKATIDDLRKKGLINTDTTTESMFDVKEALDKKVDEFSDKEDVSDEDILNLTEAYDNVTDKLSYPVNDINPTGETKNKYIKAMLVSSHRDTNTTRAKIADLAVKAYKANRQSQDTVNAIESLRNGSNIDLDSNKAMTNTIRASVSMVDNFTSFEPESLSTEANPTTKVRNEQLNESIDFLNYVVKGVNDGHIKVTSKNKKLVTSALVAHNILSNYKKAKEAQAKIKHTDAEIAVNEQKIGKNANEFLSEKGTLADKPSTFEHLSNMWKAFRANDVNAYKEARNKFDTFLNTQQKKLIALQKAYDVAHRKDSTKWDSNIPFKMNLDNTAQVEALRELASIIANENSFMNSSRNMLELAMFGSKNNDNFKFNSPFYINSPKNNFSGISQNRDVPSSEVKAYQNGINRLLSEKTSIISSSGLNSLRNTQKELYKAESLFRRRDLAEETENTVKLLGNTEPVTVPVSSQPVEVAEEDLRSDIDIENASRETSQEKAEEAPKTEEQVNDTVDSYSDEAIQNAIEGLDALGNAIDTLELANDELEESGLLLKSIPRNPDKHIDTGDRLYQLNQNVNDKFNALRNSSDNKIFTDGKVFYSNTEMLVSIDALNPSDLSNTNLVSIDTSSSIGSILGIFRNRFEKGRGESISGSVKDYISNNVKEGTSNKKLINKLEAEFNGDYFTKLSDNFNKAQEKVISELNNNNAITSLCKEYQTVTDDSRRKEIKHQIEKAILDQINNNYALPLAVFAKVKPEHDLNITPNGISFELELDKDSLHIAYLAMAQELANERDKATAKPNLESNRWENVKFKKNKKKVLAEWSYAVPADEVIQRMSRSIMGCLNIRSAFAANDVDGLFDKIAGKLLEPLDNKAFAVRTVTNPASLKAVNTSAYGSEVDVITFLNKDTDTTYDTFYTEDASQRSPSAVTTLFRSKENIPSILLGEEGINLINENNDPSKRLHGKDKVGKLEQEVIKDRQRQGFIPNKDMFKFFTKHSSVDAITKFISGIPKSEVDEYFAFEQVLKNTSNQEEAWNKFQNKYITNATSIENYRNTVYNRHEYNKMIKARATQDPYVRGYETAQTLATAMREALGSNKSEYLAMNNNEFMDAVSEKELKTVAQHYAYQITVAGRLQDISDSASPVTNKLVRELFTNLSSKEVKHLPLVQADFSKDKVHATWVLSIAQAFGAKIWQDDLASAGSYVNSMYKSLKQRLTEESLWNTLSSNANTEALDKVSAIFDELGIDKSMLSVHALLDLIKYDQGKPFTSSMYIEVDARSSGPSVALSRYNVDEPNIPEIDLDESTGFMLFNVTRPAELIKNGNKKLKDDFYQNSGNAVINEISEQKKNFFGKNSKALEIRNNLLKVISVFNSDFFKYKDGEVSDAKRTSGKTTAVPIFYGSGEGGISNQKTKDYLNGVFSAFDSMAQELSTFTPSGDTATARQNSVLEFIGNHLETIKDLPRVEKIKATKELMYALDTIYNNKLSISKTANKEEVRIIVDDSGHKKNLSLGWLYNSPDTLGNIWDAPNTIKDKLTALVTDATIFDDNADNFRANLQICIADPAYKAIQASLGKSVQQTMQDIHQVTNVVNTMKSLANSIGLAVFSKLSGNNSNVLSAEATNRMNNTELNSFANNIKVPYGEDASYPAFKDGIDRTNGNKRAEVQINNKTIRTYSAPKAVSLGVAGKPAMTQGAGDADVVDRLIRAIGQVQEFLTVFDGINIPLDSLDEVSKVITDSVYDSHKQNLYVGLLEATNAISDLLNNHKEFFNKDNSFTVVGNDVGLLLVNFLVPSYIQETFIIGDTNLREIIKEANENPKEKYPEITEEVVKRAVNTALDWYQEKAVSCAAKRAMYHGLPADMSKPLPYGSNYKTVGMHLPMGVYNMDSYGSNNQTKFEPFSYKDANGVSHDINSIGEWNQLNDETKVDISKQYYSKYNTEIENNKDTLFPIRKLDVLDEYRVSPVNLQTRVKELFTTSKDSATGRALRRINNFRMSVINVLFDKGYLDGSVNLIEIPFTADSLETIENSTSLSAESKKELKQYITDHLTSGVRTNGLRLRDNTIVLNRTASEELSEKERTTLFHELVHTGISDALFKGSQNPETTEGELYSEIKATGREFINHIVSDIARNLSEDNKDKLFNNKTLSGKELKVAILRKLLEKPENFKKDSTSANIDSIKESNSKLFKDKKLLIRSIYPSKAGAKSITQSNDAVDTAFADMFTQLGLSLDIDSRMDSEQILDSVVGSVDNVDELTTHIMSSYEINYLASYYRASDERINATKSWIKTLGEKVLNSIHRFLNSIGIGNNFISKDSIASIMATNVGMLTAVYTPSEANADRKSGTKASISNIRDVNANQLSELAKTIDKVNQKFVNKKTSYDDKFTSKYAETIAYRDNMLNQLPSYGFRYSTSEMALIRSLYTAFAIGIKADTKLYRQISATFTKALGAFNQEYLSPENKRDNPNEARQALLKYRFLMGNYSIEDKNSDERNSRLLPTFMALAAVDPALKEFFKEQINVPNEPYTSENSLEQSIVRLVTKAAETVDNLFDKAKGNENHNLLQLENSYIKALLNDGKNGSYVSKSINGLTDAVGDAVNKVDANATNKVVNVLQPLRKMVQPLMNTPLAPLAVAVKLALSKPEEIPEGYSRFDLLNGFAYDLGRSIPAQFIQSFTREYNSRTPLTLSVMKAAKACKDMVQVKSKLYKEDIPKSVEKSLPNMKKSHWERLYRSVGRTDLTALASYRDNFSDLSNLLDDKHNIQQLLNRKYGQFLDKYSITSDALIKYTKPLANYMVTGRFTVNSQDRIYDVQRNSDAILKKLGISLGSNELARQDLDEIISLECLMKTDKKDLNHLSELLNNKDNHKGFAEVWDILAKCKATDRAKLGQYGQILNRWQGYLPSTPTNEHQVSVIDGTSEAAKNLEILGYKKIASYRKSPADIDGTNLAYYTCDYNPEATFMSGALQLINYTAGGVNLETGVSSSHLRPPVMDLKNSWQSVKIEDSISRNGNGEFPLVPVYDRYGNITKYERTSDPRYTDSYTKIDHYLPNVIGNWMGRQNGESELRDSRKKIIKAIKDMYDSRKGITYKYVNLLDPDTIKKYPHLKDSIERLRHGTLKEDIEEIFGKSNTFIVRIDMLEQIVGQRRASISDIFLDENRSELTKVIASCLDSLFGAHNLIKLERYIQKGVITLKNNIVVKSLSVPAQNVTANVIELNMLGVPLKDIATKFPRKVRECETYLRYEKEIISLEYEKAKQSLNNIAAEKIDKRIEEIKAAEADLSIYPMIKAGEFNTITDVTTIREDLVVLQGEYGANFDEAIAKLPDSLRMGIEQGLVTKNTAIYKFLAKATQYGDLVAKSILYDHVLETKKDVKQAEYMATTFFVDYDLMPGRTRDYLESIGLVWFYNYKLRMSKVLVHMIANNPLRLLLWGVSPQALGFSALDTPLRDSFLGRLFGFGPSLAATAFTGAPGMVITGLMSNPWLVLGGLIL